MSNHGKSDPLTSRRQKQQVIEHLEAELQIQNGRFFLMTRGIKVEITIYQAQLINMKSSGFMIDLDCHQLDERIYGHELAQRMHQTFEERQKNDFNGAIQAAIALIQDQSA